MINPHAEPIAHVSPYKRIELGARDKQPEPKWAPRPEPVESGWQHLNVGDLPPWGEPIESELLEASNI